ncbi:MAG: hypothetical protein KBT36_08975 [Kurthia sp.]|nr:hypothetical protein [Candidatus Kurthia equi]
MAEISKIALNGNSYTLKDEIARQNANRRNRKFVLIGDSYGMRHNNNWTSFFANNHNVVARESRAGVGCAPNTHANSSFLDIAKNIVSGLTQAQRKSVTDVVVCGGWNDARGLTEGDFTVSQWRTHLYALADYCQAQFPNCIFHLGFIGWQMGDCSYINVCSFENLRKMQNAYMQSKAHGIHYLTGVENVMKCSLFYDDSKFHPNDSNGAQYLYWAIAEAVLTGAYHFHLEYTINPEHITINNTAIVNSIENVHCAVDNGTALLKIALTTKNGITNTASQKTLITFDDFVLPHCYDEAVVATGTVNAVVNGENLINTCYLQINHNKQLKGLLPVGSYTTDGKLAVKFVINTAFTF